MADISPYRIAIPDDKLDSLKQKLKLTNFPNQFEPVKDSGNVSWDYGTPVDIMQRLTKYWIDGFDWRKAEAKLNELPMFWTEIPVEGYGTIGVHFVHQKSDNVNSIPLLFSHGWPGCFLEVTKLLPLLTSKNGDSSRPTFHVVAPSLPNFGFSSGAASKGFGLPQYAEVAHKLMRKLGYDKYVTQGGDWGYSVTRALGYLYPEHVLASHLNMALSGPPSPLQPLLYLRHLTTPASQRDLDGHVRSKWFDENGYGYNLLQSSKPSTIGFLLEDSPVGLLAWIYEKLHDWTDDYPWTDDELLTWISIYWFSTAGPAASVRIYNTAQRPDPDPTRETTISTSFLTKTYVPHVKLGIAHFPKELHVVPHTWAATLGPVVQQVDYTKGGHFAAWEVPEAIAGDLWRMFGKGGPCEGISERLN